jgi:hypothetical protein
MARIEFVRGDGNHHTFSLPASSWSAGGRLFFAAKPVIDDDNTDSNSVINGDWGDEVVTDILIRDVPYKQYACYFPPSATNSTLSDGAGEIDYLGEFQWVPLGGDPVTFPPTDEKLDCVLYFDVKRKTTP